MKPYWLSILPLGAAAIISIARRQRTLVVGLGLATALTCAGLALSLPRDEVTLFLGQPWMLDRVAQALLAFMYIATAALLVIAATTEQGGSLYAPVLASLGLLSAVVLLRSLLLSLLLLPAALVVLVLAVCPSPSAVRGASRFLIWVTLPIPFVLAAFMLLDRFALFPDELALTNLSAWLIVPPVILWLTLFPFQGTTRVWAADGLSLAPIFLWMVKDWVIIYLLLALWRQNPILHTEYAAMALGIAGLLTAAVSGVLAFTQSSLSSALACAAMSELGIALQGVTSGSVNGLLGGLFLLVNRSLSVLLAGCALVGIHSISTRESESNTKSEHWRGLVMLIAFVVGVLTLAGLPPLGGFVGRRLIYTTLQPDRPYLLLAWLSASTGIALGLVRTGWSLWQAKVQSPSGRVHGLLLFLAICLLLLCLWIGYRPQAILDLISALLR